jgi:hypothetical protein
LEWLKQKTGKNHFAMKTQIYLAAQQAAYNELKNLSTPKGCLIPFLGICLRNMSYK